MNKEEQFDHLLRDKLSNIQPTMPANAWEKFSRHSQRQAYKDGNVFDEHIKSKVGTIANVASAGSWDAFKSHWNQNLVSETTQFDNQIRQKVGDMSNVPSGKAQQVFDSAYKTATEERRLWVSKLFESALLCAILLMLLLWIPSKSTSYERDSIQDVPKGNHLVRPESIIPQANDKAQPTKGDHPQESASSADANQSSQPMAANTLPSNQQNTSSTVNKGQEAISSFHSSSSKSSESSSNDMAFGERPSNKDMTTGRVVMNRNGADGGLGSSDQRNTTILPPTSGEAMALAQAEQSNKVGSSTAQAMSTNVDQQLVDFARIGSQIDVLETIATATTTSPKSFYHPDDFPSYNPIAIKDLKANKLISTTWIGVRVGQVFNFIKTPSSNEQNRNIVENYARSTILGFNIELKNKFVNLETGINYTSFEIGFDALRPDKIHLVNIPLSLKKEFFPKSKYNPFIKVGPDVNVALAASYFPDLSSNGNRSGSDEKALAPGFAYLETKEEEGLLRSGNFLDNSYFGVHGSMGIDWKINPLSKLSLEVTQQLNPFNKGLGINNHRLSAVSINLGYKQLLF